MAFFMRVSPYNKKMCTTEVVHMKKQTPIVVTQTNRKYSINHTQLEELAFLQNPKITYSSKRVPFSLGRSLPLVPIILFV